MANPINSPKLLNDVGPIDRETEQLGSKFLSIQISLINSSLGPKSTIVVGNPSIPLDLVNVDPLLLLKAER